MSETEATELGDSDGPAQTVSRPRRTDSHPCGACRGPVSREFGCNHFGSPVWGNHYRHAVCCAYMIAEGRAPRGPLLVGRAATDAQRRFASI